MTDGVLIDLAWYDGLEHREAGALALLLAHAQPALAEYPGCLPDDDLLLCDFAGFGVQLSAWRRMRKTVLVASPWWRRVRHASGAILWAHEGLCAALGVAAGVTAEAMASAPRMSVTVPLTAEQRRKARDRVKKRRKRARAAGADGYVDADGCFVRFDGGLSPRDAAVPPGGGGQSPGMSPGLSPETVALGAENHAQRPSATRSREESPPAMVCPPDTEGQPRAGARVEEKNPTISQAEPDQTTTTGPETHAQAQAGGGAHEAAWAGEVEGKAARQGTRSPLSGAELEQACARVYQAWLAERRTAFAGAAPPTSPRDVQFSIIAQWFGAGASEATLLNAIKLQVRTLKTPPNTIQAIYLSVGQAITQQLSLPLLQQTVGGRVAELRLRPSMLPYAQRLLARLPDIGVLNAWFGALEVGRAEVGDKGVRLLAPNGFVRGWVMKEYGRVLNEVFGADAWQVTVPGHKARGAA